MGTPQLLTDASDEEDHLTSVQINPKGPNKEDSQEDLLAEKSTDVDSSQVLEWPLPIRETAPLEPDTSEQTLEKLHRIADTFNPVSEEDIWKKRSDSNILIRLNMAAQKLKDWQTKANQESPQKDVQEDSQLENKGQAPDQGPACHSSAEQDSDGSKDNSSQKPLEERTLDFHVEPMTCPPSIVHPIPKSSLQMPPGIHVNFTTKLNRVAKMRTDPVCYKAKLVGAMTTRPRVVLQRLPPKDSKVHSATI